MDNELRNREKKQATKITVVCFINKVKKNEFEFKEKKNY